jgi:hypothetical protein
MKIDDNTIKLTRALIKLSSSINDIDDLNDDINFKTQLKYDVLRWQSWLEGYIKNPITVFSDADSSTLMSLITMFDQYEDEIFIMDNFTTRINLFLSKTESAINDIKLMNTEYLNYVSLLRNKGEEMLNKPYFKKYIKYVDVNNAGYKEIVKSIDDLGNTIIVGTL